MYGLRCIINRCGILAGPWQMGRVDQGVFALWVAMHRFGRELSYTGWGGQGKQVRDLLHIDDLAELVDLQLARFGTLCGQIYNVGGGVASSLSLREATALCREIAGRTVPIRSVPQNTPADVKWYITDAARVQAATGWAPRRTPRQTLADIDVWLAASEALVGHLWRS
jgi:CDP-paratose 2-epimerase